MPVRIDTCRCGQARSSSSGPQEPIEAEILTPPERAVVRHASEPPRAVQRLDVPPSPVKLKQFALSGQSAGWMVAAAVLVGVFLGRGNNPPQPSQQGVVVVTVPAAPRAAAEASAQPVTAEPTPAPDAEAPTEEPASLDSAPKSERDQQYALADSIYRPHMMQVVDPAKRFDLQRRRYEAACRGKKTVTVREGERGGSETSQGTAVGSATSDSRSVGVGVGVDSQGNAALGVGVAAGQTTTTTTENWSGTRHWFESWSEAEYADNETTVECRLIAHELTELSPKITSALAAAEREAVQRGVWTWLQSEIPDRLAAELWGR
ncbi:MAG: hypothetical protein NDJ94_12990 [Vicinamibacteria bacterium]|nr:hypothetical protein [Vicinamibacteria bacterium]